MKYLVALLSFTCVIFYSRAGNLDDAERYIDEVLNVYLPNSVQKAGLDVYELPDISYNSQNRSDDGTATTVKVLYHLGNLTGLESVSRKTCKEPEWTSNNLTIRCTLRVPEIKVKYVGRLWILNGHMNNIRFRQFYFDVKGTVNNVEAEIEVTASPQLKIPSIKSMSIVDAGKPEFILGLDQDVVSVETLITHFYHKFDKVFRDMFNDSYRKAFEEAVESPQFPF